MWWVGLPLLPTAEATAPESAPAEAPVPAETSADDSIFLLDPPYWPVLGESSFKADFKESQWPIIFQQWEKSRPPRSLAKTREELHSFFQLPGETSSMVENANGEWGVLTCSEGQCNFYQLGESDKPSMVSKKIRSLAHCYENLLEQLGLENPYVGR